MKSEVQIDSPAPVVSLESSRHEAPRLRRSRDGKFLIPAKTQPVLGERKTVTKSLYDPFTGEDVVFEKSNRPSARDDKITGAALGALVGGPGAAVHGAVRGKKGKKGRAALSGLGYGSLGAFGGALAATSLSRGNLTAARFGGAAGGGAGGMHAAHRNREMDRVKKSGYGGSGLPDRVYGASTPMIGQTRSVGALVPTGKHVSHVNDLDRFTGLKEKYRRQPTGHSRQAQRLLQVSGKSGGTRSAREFRGEVKAVTKADDRDGKRRRGAGAAVGAGIGAGQQAVRYTRRGTYGGVHAQVKRGAMSRAKAGRIVGLPLAADAAYGATAGALIGLNPKRKVKKADTKRQKPTKGEMAGIGAGAGLIHNRVAASQQRGDWLRASRLMQQHGGSRKKVAGTLLAVGGANAATNAGIGAALAAPFGRSKKKPVRKADTVHRLTFGDVDRSATYGRQVGRRGARIA